MTPVDVFGSLAVPSIPADPSECYWLGESAETIVGHRTPVVDDGGVLRSFLVGYEDEGLVVVAPLRSFALT
jgi:hypothetical protein